MTDLDQFDHLSKLSMNQFTPLFLPAVLGLLAGVTHGLTSHYQDLPFSLIEQVVQSVQAEPSFD